MNLVHRVFAFAYAACPLFISVSAKAQDSSFLDWDFAAPSQYDVDTNPPSAAVGSIVLDSKTAHFRAKDSVGVWQDLSTASFPASATVSGYVKGGASASQTFSGTKTFQDGVAVPTSGSSGNVYSGTYTPTVTTNSGTSSLVVNPAQFIRVGNVVTVSGAYTVASSATISDFRMSLPISTTFTNAYQLGGNAGAEVPTVQSTRVLGDTSNQAARFITSWTTTTSATVFSFSFTYQIL